MKVAVFGGRFDPPHFGHYLVAKQILDFREDIDQVILMPANQHQWKPTEATGEQRAEMLKFIESDRIIVSDIELRRGGVSYSIDTVREIKKQNNSEVFWIVGSDIVFEFEKWERSDELIKEAKFLIFPRDPYHLPENIPNGFEVIKDELLITTNISSTIIRERIKRGLSIKGFVNDSIDKYISENNLYK